MPIPPGSNKGLASILGSCCWEKQTEAKCPEAGQFWKKEVEKGEWWLGERASGPQYGAEKMTDLGEYRPIRK